MKKKRRTYQPRVFDGRVIMADEIEPICPRSYAAVHIRQGRSSVRKRPPSILPDIAIRLRSRKNTQTHRHADPARGATAYARACPVGCGASRALGEASRAVSSTLELGHRAIIWDLTINGFHFLPVARSRHSGPQCSSAQLWLSHAMPRTRRGSPAGHPFQSMSSN
jgi:hypothetical protein